MSIKAGTISRYLVAAAELLLSAKMMNPCLDIMEKQSVYIKDILKESEKWESIPNRKEPVTKQMIEHIIQKGKDLQKNNLDNMYAVLGDWLVPG